MQNGRFRIGDLMGAKVDNQDGDQVGTISDIIFNEDAEPQLAIVSYGGFLGINEQSSAVPFDLIKGPEDTREGVMIPLNQAELTAAPQFEDGSFEWLSDDDWIDDNNDYYDEFDNGGSS